MDFLVGRDVSFTVLQMFIDAPYRLFIGWAASILSWICIRLSSLVQSTHNNMHFSTSAYFKALCITALGISPSLYSNKTWIVCYTRQYYLLHTSLEVQDLKWLAAALCGCTTFFELWSGTIAHQCMGIRLASSENSGISIDISADNQA